MSDPPTPFPPINPATPSWIPNLSTSATAGGGAFAAIVVWVLGQYHIFMPAGIEAAVAVLACSIASYLPKSGRIQK
jgi:hypothetical protein